MFIQWNILQFTSKLYLVCLHNEKQSSKKEKKLELCVKTWMNFANMILRNNTNVDLQYDLLCKF